MSNPSDRPDAAVLAAQGDAPYTLLMVAAGIKAAADATSPDGGAS